MLIYDLMPIIAKEKLAQFIDVFCEKGYFSVMNMRTKQETKLNVSLLDDLAKNKTTTLNIEKAVRHLNKSLLIIHGSEDLAVKTDEAKQLYNWSDKNKTELVIIENTGHTFGCVHPFEGSNEKFEKVLEKTKSFFDKALK